MRPEDGDGCAALSTLEATKQPTAARRWESGRLKEPRRFGGRIV
jgi:hypothetical protein